MSKPCVAVPGLLVVWGRYCAPQYIVYFPKLLVLFSIPVRKGQVIPEALSRLSLEPAAQPSSCLFPLLSSRAWGARLQLLPGLSSQAPHRFCSSLVASPPGHAAVTSKESAPSPTSHQPALILHSLPALVKVVPPLPPRSGLSRNLPHRPLLSSASCRCHRRGPGGYRFHLLIRHVVRCHQTRSYVLRIQGDQRTSPPLRTFKG